MNHYALRKQLRQCLDRKRAKRRQEALLQVQDKLLLRLENAYKALYNRKPKITYYQGWYDIKGVGKFQRTTLTHYIRILEAREHELKNSQYYL